MPVDIPRVLVASIAERVGVSRAVTRTEIRRGNWQALAPGIVLTAREAPTRADWADVGLAIAGPTAALSGWDAARMYGLGDPTAPSPTVLVISRHTSSRVVGSVRIRETSRPYNRWTTPVDAHPHALTPLVSAARAVCDAALDYRHLNSVRALVSAAIQRRRCSPAQLVAEYERGPRQHSRLLRMALSDVVEGARSAAEAVAAQRLRRPGIPAFQLNAEIRDATGLIIVDVYWAGLRAALEVDSREYHFSEVDWK